MNKEREFVYIQHILECITQIKEYSKNGQEDFNHNVMVQDAILRRLQTMAESCQRLSDDVKAQIPDIDWRNISGFRNILVHDYLDGINLQTLWEVVEDYLPNLEIAIENIAANFWNS